MTRGAFGPYRVVEELGAGSLSTVYKAEHETLGRIVAIKALKETIAPTSPFAAQLEREARVLAGLGHANIVALYDFVKTEQRMHLVLEFVDGWSLAAVLGRRARFSLELVCAIGMQIARGLAHAHERGVVHRDVKPANVIISRRGEVKLCDFGIAQRDRLPSADEPIAPKRGESDTAFGTPAYMSPEQILGETVDPRSDVFSLGVVLYQLLAGVRPFEKEGENSRSAAAQRIRREPARPLRERAPEVPRALERIVMRCVEKLPADRFERADEVADRLEELFRARTSEKPAAVIVRALVAAGLVEGVGGTSEIRVMEEPRAAMRPVLAGFGVILGVFVICGSAIQWAARGEQAANASGQPLELAPSNAGMLRVVASPWADVAIDGQHVDTTPFARAIALSSGTHYVTFTHPDAPAETRTIVVRPGETTMLDVAMRIRGAEGAVAISKDGGT